jgi:hypothetical protein
MNLSEQFYSLVFQTLQPRELQAWLPEGITVEGGHGLNLALPVHQGSVHEGTYVPGQRAWTWFKNRL